MKYSFKQQVDNYFRGFRLSKKRLARLEALQKNPVGRRLAERRVWRAPALQIAVILLLACGAMLLWQLGARQTGITALSAEIAYNHNKRMAMEISSPSLPEVREYLSKLDFVMIESERLPRDTWELLGGRYCALGGELAAQLKMRHRPTDRVCTLFQTGLADVGSLAGKDTLERYQDGVKVTLWAERGLLLGMAGEI